MTTPTPSNGPTPLAVHTRSHVQKPGSPEEAARAFETLLVREFVRTMTKDLFRTSLAGGGPMAAGQADLQRDRLTEFLTATLVDGGTLRLRDLLLRQWERQAAAPDGNP
jgi:flagellar protein FlgJ